jgi:hypothetical protein
LRTYNQELRGAFLLQKQSEIEKGYGSSRAAERAVAIRDAFEAVSVFGVRLEPDLSLVKETDKNLYLSALPVCEQAIAQPILYYSKETGKFSSVKDPNVQQASLQGQVSGQSIRFRGGGGTVAGDLVSTSNDWIFTGLVTCFSAHRYKGVLQLR